MPCKVCNVTCMLIVAIYIAIYIAIASYIPAYFLILNNKWHAYSYYNNSPDNNSRSHITCGRPQLHGVNTSSYSYIVTTKLYGHEAIALAEILGDSNQLYGHKHLWSYIKSKRHGRITLGQLQHQWRITTKLHMALMTLAIAIVELVF